MPQQYRIEHYSTLRSGEKVRSVRRGGHVVRIAFPHGRRIKGSGRVLEVLHPQHENPCRLPNPAELVVMMANPHSAPDARATAATPGLQGATEMCEGFRGSSCEHVDTFVEPEPRPVNLGQLFNLVELQVKRPTGWKWGVLDFVGKGIQGGGEPYSHQIYFVGGDQKISRGQLTHLGVDNGKQIIDLGECMIIAYRQKKMQVNGNWADYEHKFGDVTGRRPRLIYDRRGPQPRLLLAGGEYTITPEGIVN
jgi:hypothetical protein